MLKILVIEPNELDHYIFKQIFASEYDFMDGHGVMADLDFYQAVAIDSSVLSSSGYDAVLCSVKNQKPTDIEFNNIKTLFSRTPVLVIDDVGSNNEAKHYLGLGAADYLVLGHYPGALIKKSVLNSIEKQRFIDRIEDLELRVESLKSRNDLVSKFAALGEITANIAHEINTPLSTILINVEYIQSDIKQEIYDRDNVEKMLSVISRTCFRIAEIVKTLRDFARRRDGDPPTIISMKRVIEDALELFTVKTRSSSVSVSFDFPADSLCEVKGNFVELFLVVINLLNNAYDAVNGSEGAWIKIELTHEGAGVRFSVTDSGSGISLELQRQIFDPFFTTKIGHGIGLGLNICEKIIRRHGGQVILDKNYPQTRFIVDLPVPNEKEKE